MVNHIQCTDHVWLIVSKITGLVLTLILTFTTIALKSHAAMNSMLYVPNVAHNEVFIADEQLDIFEAESKMMCLMLCNHNEQCKSISYNSQSMQCQHFLVQFWNRQTVIRTWESGWTHYDPFRALDCKDFYEKQYPTGIYAISPGNIPSFSVKCDMDFDGGGWTLIQERFNWTVDFQRTWAEYKTGFGDLKGELWLGNDQISAITSSADYELRIDISDWHGNSWYAVYKTFIVKDENSQYKLTIGNYNGTAGDDMAFHDGARFSTKDRDYDSHSTVHCSEKWGGNGGWWYASCDRANLNSVYGEDIGEKTGIEWTSARDDPFTMKTTRMMIRRL